MNPARLWRPARRPAEPAALPVDGAEENDPEGTPPLPSATLAAGAAPRAEGVRAPGTSYAEIWGLSWPVMLSQVLANAVSLIDVAMVGRLGSDAVAAVGYAGQFFSLVQSALFAVAAACVALMARAIGGGSALRARRALTASITTATASAIAIGGVVVAAPRAWLAALGAEPAVIELALPYLFLLLGSSLLLAPSMMLESALRADRDTRTPMLIALAVTVVKIALNAVLIFGALCAAGREQIGHLFVDDPATVATLAPFLLCLAVSQPFLQANFALGGALRGAGDTTTPFLAALAGSWALRLPLAFAFAYGLRAPIEWIWWSLTFDHLTRAAWLAWSFRRGRWRRAGVV